VLAFITALPTLIYDLRAIRPLRAEVIGLALFALICLSALWSEASFIETLEGISEYRLYFMVPVFSFVLSGDLRYQKLVLNAVLGGALISLLASYGLGFNLIEVEGARFSLANRIYHGFIMAILLAYSLIRMTLSSDFSRYYHGAIAALIVYNILNIEIGRTGYLLVIAVFCVIIVYSSAAIVRVGLFSALLLGLVVSYLSLESFGGRVDQTLANVYSLIQDGEVGTSAGFRLGIYKVALEIYWESPFFGLGVGDVAQVLVQSFYEGRSELLTDNVHNEYLNMLLVGGGGTFILYIYFIGQLARTGSETMRKSREIGIFLVSMAVIIAVASLFNSTIKDFGEKHALIVLLSLLFSRVHFLQMHSHNISSTIHEGSSN
jgi:O-antigen ligase